jgi:DNA-binding NtrC family response regulator
MHGARQLIAENTALRQNLQAQGTTSRAYRAQPEMKQVFDLIIQAAPSRSTILINGESALARERSRARSTPTHRAGSRVVTVNSGNLPPELLESTLFGHVKGRLPARIPEEGLCDMRQRRIFSRDGGNIPPRPRQSCCA